MDDDSFEAACAQQEREEGQRWEADRLAQLHDRLAYEAISIYIDRVLDLIVGKATPF